MTVIFSKVEAEITDDLISKFSNEFDFDAMLRKVCEDAGVLIEIETFVHGLEVEVNAPDQVEQKKSKYKLKGLWVAMEKAYRNLVTTVALYGSRMADGSPTDDGLADILDNPLSDVGFDDDGENDVSKSILGNHENKTKRRPRKSAVQSRKLISTMTKDEEDDILDGCEISFLKSEDSEAIKKELDKCVDLNELEGKENDSENLEESKPVEVKRGRGRPRKGFTPKTSLAGKTTTKKRGRPKKYGDGASPPEYPCPHCPYVAKRRYKLKSHINEVHQTDPTHCPICDKVFPNRRYMMRHKESHGGPQHCCDICGKMYKIKKAMQAHRKTHEATYKKPSFQCEECPKSFCNQYVLDVHVRDIHRGLKKSYLCSVCGKSFTTKHSLSEHSNAHNGLKPYQCGTCGKTFSYESALRDHKFSHIEKSFWCSHCQKSFSQRSGLKMHMRTHRLHKTFVCSECGRGFTQKQALQRHERVHKGEKPYICKHCGKYFTDASIIRRHLILVHKIKKSAKVWREDIICTIVGDKDHHVLRVSEEDKYSSIEREKEEVMRNVGLQSKSNSKKGPSRAFQRVYPRKVVVLDDEDNVINVPEISIVSTSNIAPGKEDISVAHSEEVQIKVIHSQSLVNAPVLSAPDGSEIDPQIINQRYIDQNQWDALTGHLTKGAAQLEPIILEDTSQQDVQRNQDQVLNLQKIVKCETAQGIVTAETNPQVNHQTLHSPQYSPVSFTPLTHSSNSKTQENQFESLTAQLTNTSGQYYDIRGSSHSAVPWSSMYYYSHLANQLGINIGSDLSYVNAAGSAAGTSMGSCVMQSSMETQQLSATSLVVHKTPQEVECDAAQQGPHLTNVIPSSSLDSTHIPCIPNIPTLMETNHLHERKLNTNDPSSAQPNNSTTTIL